MEKESDNLVGIFIYDSDNPEVCVMEMVNSKYREIDGVTTTRMNLEKTSNELIFVEKDQFRSADHIAAKIGLLQSALNTDSPENLIARIKAKAVEVQQEHAK